MDFLQRAAVALFERAILFCLKIKRTVFALCLFGVKVLGESGGVTVALQLSVAKRCFSSKAPFGQDFQKRDGVVGGDKGSAVVDAEADVLFGVGAVEVHGEAFRLIEGEKFGADEFHGETEFVVVGVGIRLELLHLEVGIAHSPPVVVALEVLDNPRIEGVEVATVKQVVLLEKRNGEVNGLLGVLLNLHAEDDVGALFGAKAEEFLQRGDANALICKFVAELVAADRIQFANLREGHIPQMAVCGVSAGARRDAVMGQDGNFVACEPDIEFNRVHAEIQRRRKGNERIFGVARAVSSVPFNQNVFHVSLSNSFCL